LKLPKAKLDNSSKKKGNHGNSKSAASKRSTSGSNQPTADQMLKEIRTGRAKERTTLLQKKITKTKQPLFNSPANQQ